MMRYYKELGENGKVKVLGIGLGGVEITESEYNTLLSEMREKADLRFRLYRGEISTDDVPETWREEIQKDVEVMISMHGSYDERELSAEEALEIILGGNV